MQLRSLLPSTIKITLGVVALGAVASRPALLAAPASVPSTQPSSIALVELFTSEGCSSCPPADALLEQVHLRQSAAGQLIIGLSEHVTYWNHLGWTDRYSQQAFTDRQQLYASRLSPDGAYTPQMVLNGHDQFVGSNRAALEQALRSEAHRKSVDLRIVSQLRESGGLALKFSLAGSASQPLEIIAVLTDDRDRSEVLRGENSGHMLQHVSVARSLSRLATVTGDTERSVHLPLPSGFEPAAAAAHHLVIFAQRPHQGEIVGAAIVPLTP